MVLVAARDVARRAAISADPPDNDEADASSIDGEELSDDELRVLQEGPNTGADEIIELAGPVTSDLVDDTDGVTSAVAMEAVDAVSVDGDDSEVAFSTCDDY